MELIEYVDADMMMLALASALSRDLRAALARRERAVLCVPGGDTPGPVFDLLAAVELDWARVDVLLTDERWVPEDHPRSNARQVRERLLQGPAAAARLVPLWSDVPEPGAVLDELNRTIGALMPIDVVLLGMGEDMHVASLFAGAPRLDEALADDAPPIMAMAVPGQPELRVTMTAPYLRKAFAVHLVITGEAKRAALDRAEGADPLDAPVLSILGSASVHWSA